MMRWLLKLLSALTGPSEAEVMRALRDLEKAGLVEVVGLDHGESIYRITDRGIAYLKRLEAGEVEVE